MKKFVLSLLVLGMTTTVYAKPRLNVTRKAPERVEASKGRSNVQAIRLSCEVSGTPVEFPNDLVVKNNGKESIKKGKTLVWSIKGKKGEFKLEKDLGAGEFVSILDVLGSGLEAGKKCKVALKQNLRRLSPKMRKK
jgi:hypothetical protein